MTGPALTGWRVVVPRGGAWGDRVAALLRDAGAEPVVVPLVRRVPPSDPAALELALARLEAGEYDGLAVTSAATAEVLAESATVVPAGVVVGAVGPATAAALDAAGVPASLVPDGDHSGRGLAAAWPDGTRRVLALRSQIAGPDLIVGLRDRGIEVDDVAAYSSVPTGARDAVADPAAAAVASARAALVTSGSVARALAAVPGAGSLVVACLGPATARDARDAGLRVAVVAEERSTRALVAALAAHAARSEESAP